MDWWYAENGQQVGPVQEETFLDLVRTGRVQHSTLVWHPGLPNWQPYSTLAPELSRPPAFLAFTYGGFWIRFLARVIDSMIVTAASFALSIPLIGALSLGSSKAGFVLAQVLVTLMLLAGNVAYDVVLTVEKGGTVGKLVLGLQIVTPDGRRLTWGRAIGRYFANYITAITFFIGYIIAAFDVQKRALHDYICDTRVVRKTS